MPQAHAGDPTAQAATASDPAQAATAEQTKEDRAKELKKIHNAFAAQAKYFEKSDPALKQHYEDLIAAHPKGSNII